MLAGSSSLCHPSISHQHLESLLAGACYRPLNLAAQQTQSGHCRPWQRLVFRLDPEPGMRLSLHMLVLAMQRAP